MRLKLIYNPTAGRGRARRHIHEAEVYLRGRGVDVDCVASVSPAELAEIAAESSAGGFDRVVVCGGDGSLNLAIRRFDLSRGTLALLPLGSGDDFARVLGIPRDLRGACDVIVDGKVREVDVALANGIRYLGVAGLGFDSEVARHANERVKYLRGSLVYFWAILRVLPRFRPHRVRLTIDGRTRDEEIMFAVAANSRQYGGGICIAPDAQIDDRALDLVMIHRSSRRELLLTLPQAYSGSHLKNKFVETGRCAELSFESERTLDVYADGERLTQTPVRFALEPQRLRIIAP